MSTVLKSCWPDEQQRQHWHKRRLGDRVEAHEQGIERLAREAGEAHIMPSAVPKTTARPSPATVRQSVCQPARRNSSP
jgi:hypothetical protein